MISPQAGRRRGISRLDLDDDAHGEQVRARSPVAVSRSTARWASCSASPGPIGAQPDPRAGAAEDGEREAVERRERRGLLEALDLALGAVEVARLHREVREVVARHRLLPGVAGLDREPQDLGEPRVPVADADIPEHDARAAAGEDAQFDASDPVRELDRPLGLGERLGIRAGEEVQLPLDGRQLRARVVVVGRLGKGLRLAGQRDGPCRSPRWSMTAACSTSARQRSAGSSCARDLVAAHRVGKRRIVILVVEVTRPVQRAVHLVGVARAHHHRFGLPDAEHEGRRARGGLPRPES